MPGLTCTCASSGVEVVVFLLLPVTEGSIFGPEKSRKIRHAKTDLCRAVCWAICNKLTTSTKEEGNLGGQIAQRESMNTFTCRTLGRFCLPLVELGRDS